MSSDARLLPHRPPVDEPTRDTRVLELDTEAAASVCSALASETATRLLSRLFDEPSTASALAEDVGTSLQNTHYHLTRLADAGLVTVVDTWYSSRGTEMKVYAPTHDEFVITPTRGDDAATSDEGDGGGDGPRVEQPSP